MANKKQLTDLGLPWIGHLLLQIFLGALWGAIVRISRGKLLWGVIYLITGGFIGIGWIIDVVTLITDGDYKLLA